MRRVNASLMLSVVLIGGGAHAGPIAQRSPDAFIKAIQSEPCANGAPRDQAGVCPPAVGATKGFTLFDRSAAKPGAAARHGATIAPRPRWMSTARRHRSVLSDLMITFKVGSSELTDQGQAEAMSFAKALATPAVSGARFEIAGYTDASGSRIRNRALSQARAEAVRAFLVSHGIDQSRLEARGYGSDDLAVPANPRDAANRRVEAHSLN